MQYWLIKSEPNAFSIHDLAKAKKKTTHWEGVRNYQARNFLRAMKKGDVAIFYHSNAEPSAVAGVVEVVREAYPDASAGMELLRRGSRLSVHPVTPAEFRTIQSLASKRPAARP